MAPAEYSHHDGRAVCVMDSACQLGSALLRHLLRRGYTVHAASQSSGEPRGLKGLSSEERSRVRTFVYDPFDYQSILDSLRGCSGLFYNFQPPEDHPTYDEYTVELEVRAANNVLEACAQTETMERVVYTSSVTAVIWKENSKTSTSDLDERHWSDPNFCKKFKLWHALAKTVAEKAAWALAMDRDVDMVSINAGLLVGPSLSITNPYLKGAAEMYEDGVFVTVDDKLLADAHICVYEDPSAYGRYVCFDHLIGCHEDTVKLANMLTPSAPCPPICDESNIRQRIHNKKLNKLMDDFDCEPENMIQASH